MEKKWYEFEVGFFVEADDEDEAWNIAQGIVEEANKIDPEGDAGIEFHGQYYGTVRKEKNVHSD